MARITLSEQLEAIISSVKERKERDLQKFFQENPRHEEAFYVDFIGEIHKVKIQGYHIDYYGDCIHYRTYLTNAASKKVTKDYLDNAREYVNLLDKAEVVTKVLIHRPGMYSAESARLSDIIPSKGYSFNEYDLKEISEKRRELYAPRDGYVPCAYCRKQVRIEEVVKHDIIFQNSRPDPFSKSGYKRFVDRKTNNYCSGKCAGNDQMAHEG